MKCMFLAFFLLPFGARAISQRDGDSLFKAVDQLNKAAGNCSKEMIKISFRDNKVCTDHNAFFNKAMQNPKTIEQMFREMNKQDPKVIFFGDLHEKGMATHHAALVDAAKNEFSDIDCLYLEMPPELNRDIEALLSGKVQSNVDLRIERDSNLIIRANQLGIKVFAGDPEVRGPGSKHWNISDKGIATRNNGMEKLIAGNLRDGICKRSLMIVGSAHVATPRKRAFIGVPALLKGKGVNTAAIALESDGREGNFNYSTGFHLTFCEKNPSPPERTVVLDTKNPPSSLFMEYTSELPWQDFDYTIVYPASH